MYVLVFNGELYNFAGLRRQLEQRGVRFSSHSDSEVVLYSLAEWGRDALDRFNGMFALGFYDSRERKLLLARDHAGIKPLYYLKNPAGLMFGSQYDQLLTHPWSAGLAYAPAAAALYLHLASVPAPYAILENTSMLEPGSWLEVDAEGRISQGCYYELARPGDEKSQLTRESLAGVLVDRKAVRSLYREDFDGQELEWGLWPLLSPALWEDRHGR